MSKRSFSVFAISFALVTATLALVPREVHSQGRVQITIDSLASQTYEGDTVTLSVNVTTIAQGTSVNAFDLLIAFDHFMRPIAVEPGALLNSCGWEFFNSTTAPPNFCRLDTCPDAKIHMVALADLSSRPGSPACFIDHPGEIARLTFEVTSRELPCNFFHPVQFTWDDCGDNMLTLSTTLDTALIADQVYLLSFNITDYGPLPNSTGPPDDCVISNGSTGQTVRAVEFIGGGVVTGCPSPLASGAEIGLLDLGSDQWIGEPFSVYLDVLRIVPGTQLGSFELYVKYDPTKMTFLGAEPGSLISSCNYASFDVKVGPDADCNLAPCPEGVLRILAIAHGLQSTPTCYIGTTGPLVKLNFQMANDSSLICSSLPIDFYWNRCADNNFTEAPDELSAVFTRTVLDRFGFIFPDTGTAFPNITGPLDTCSLPNQSLDFLQGVVLVPCERFLDIRGDMNLNRINYEIADYLVFTNYLLYGSSAFTVFPSDQVAASDVNADGLSLTLADMIYLLRVIVKDTVAVSSPSKAATDTVFIQQDNNTKSIILQTQDSLSALYLVFDGEVTPSTNALSNHLVAANFDGEFTRLLISPNLQQAATSFPRFGSIALNGFYIGDGVLIGAEATNDGLFDQPTQITLSGFQSCCVTRGNINHSVDQTIDIADVAALVQYMFAFGSEPPCLEEANVNGSGNGRIDVADLVFLIAFMFRDGPTPPSCPTQTRTWRYIATAAGRPVAEGLFTMSVDDPPTYAGQWTLDQLDPNAIIGPQVGQGSWIGDDSGGSLIINMNTMQVSSRVTLNITNKFQGVWIGTWEYLEEDAVINNGQVILEAL